MHVIPKKTIKVYIIMLKYIDCRCVIVVERQQDVTVKLKK